MGASKAVKTQWWNLCKSGFQFNKIYILKTTTWWCWWQSLFNVTQSKINQFAEIDFISIAQIHHRYCVKDMKKQKFLHCRCDKNRCDKFASQSVGKFAYYDFLCKSSFSRHNTQRAQAMAHHTLCSAFFLLLHMYTFWS